MGAWLPKSKLFVMAPSMCRSSGWNLLVLVTPVASRMLRWLPRFWKICEPLPQRHVRVVELQIHLFLTLVVDVVEW
jgi:hypothetical protein